MEMTRGELGFRYGPENGRRVGQANVERWRTFGMTAKELESRRKTATALGKKFGGRWLSDALRALAQRKRTNGLTAKELDHVSAAGKEAHRRHPQLAKRAGAARFAGMSARERSEFGRRAVMKRWHPNTVL